MPHGVDALGEGHVLAAHLDLQVAGDAARGGAERVALCWVQKVSNLILNVNIEVRDAASGATLYAKSVDIRGNTDESWLRGVRRLVDNVQEREHLLR